jgi:hypothetical protein
VSVIYPVWHDKARRNANLHHAFIVSLMAGAEAEAELLGLRTIGDGADRAEIEFVAQELTCDWTKLEPQLRRMTRMLVRRHRVRIEHVAKALLVERKLSGDQVDQLVGRESADRAQMCASMCARPKWTKLTLELSA